MVLCCLWPICLIPLLLPSSCLILFFLTINTCHGCRTCLAAPHIFVLASDVLSVTLAFSFCPSIMTQLKPFFLNEGFPDTFPSHLPLLLIRRYPIGHCVWVLITFSHKFLLRCLVYPMVLWTPVTADTQALVLSPDLAPIQCDFWQDPNIFLP